jgi:hypothetical protein
MLKASLVPEAVGRGRRNSRHMPRVDRLSLKYLVWIGAVRRIVRTLFTDPLTASISRPPRDHPRGITCIYYRIPMLLRPSF